MAMQAHGQGTNWYTPCRIAPTPPSAFMGIENSENVTIVDRDRYVDNSIGAGLIDKLSTVKGNAHWDVEIFIEFLILRIIRNVYYRHWCIAELL
jgi:hypothetical protein